MESIITTKKLKVVMYSYFLIGLLDIQIFTWTGFDPGFDIFAHTA